MDDDEGSWVYFFSPIFFPCCFSLSGFLLCRRRQHRRCRQTITFPLLRPPTYPTPFLFFVAEVFPCLGYVLYVCMCYCCVFECEHGVDSPTHHATLGEGSGMGYGTG